MGPIRQPNRLVAGAAILLLHGALFYAAGHLGLGFAPDVQLPVAVRFVSESVAPPQWKPPVVSPVRPDIDVPVPSPPMVNLPAPAPKSQRAITLAPTPAPPRPAPAEDRSAPKLVSSVEYLREPVPRYPPQSRRLREEGMVVLRVMIDENGNAGSIEIESSSGYARLDAAAREAVERAAFRPYIENGSPRRAFVLIPIEFSLNHA